jgi:SpoVK/Ycf46/Vps4 family AAA+-type ATPase
MFEKNLPYNLDASDGQVPVAYLDYQKLAETTEGKQKIESEKQLLFKIKTDTKQKQTIGYSGSDIQLVCKEAAMRSLRAIFEILDLNHDDATLTDQSKLMHASHIVTLVYA